MNRLLIVLLASALASCVSQRALPVRYDLDGVHAIPQRVTRFDATVVIPPIEAPSWLRSTALVYRLDYAPPAYRRAYALSEWTAPPSELLTVRLRERIAATNQGFTVARLPENALGYRLEVSLQNFTQVFAAPGRSRCVVTLSATVLRPGDRIVGQRTFRSERAAPMGNAAGAVEGLAAASDSDFEQIVGWLREVLPRPPASTTMRAAKPAP